jgi:hypothetical protein
MANHEEFTTFDVIKILKIKRERLKDWLQRGFIKPSRQEKTGPGLKAYFDRWQVCMIRLFQHLIEHGISRAEASLWVDKLMNRPDLHPIMPKRSIKFFVMERKGGQVIVGRSIYGAASQVELHEGIDDAFVINFQRLEKKVDEAITELRTDTATT